MKRKNIGGKILALIIAVIVIIYMSFMLHVFYNFMRLIHSDPDAGVSETTVETTVGTGSYHFPDLNVSSI